MFSLRSNEALSQRSRVQVSWKTGEQVRRHLQEKHRTCPDCGTFSEVEGLVSSKKPMSRKAEWAGSAVETHKDSQKTKKQPNRTP